MDALLDAALTTWGTLWQTLVGEGDTSVRLRDLAVPATIVGYFFEILLARELQRRDATLWRGGRSKDEKDLVCVSDSSKSVEIKCSGQAGFKIFGNRSYGQRPTRNDAPKKEKSGYYLTVNFFQQTLTLIRFGWIDAEDWDPQLAPTGQMAGLRKAVYDGKLIPLEGSYRRHAPVFLLDGAGPVAASQLAALGIATIGELADYRGELPRKLDSLRERNAELIHRCRADDD